MGVLPARPVDFRPRPPMARGTPIQLSWVNTSQLPRAIESSSPATETITRWSARRPCPSSYTVSGLVRVYRSTTSASAPVDDAGQSTYAVANRRAPTTTKRTCRSAFPLYGKELQGLIAAGEGFARNVEHAAHAAAPAAHATAHPAHAAAHALPPPAAAASHTTHHAAAEASSSASAKAPPPPPWPWPPKPPIPPMPPKPPENPAA